MRSPLPQQGWIINRKIVVRGEKNVDKIRPFQIDEKSLPAKIHGSEKGKIREARRTFISLRGNVRKRIRKGSYAEDD
jgi:hypothetical protein